MLGYWKLVSLILYSWYFCATQKYTISIPQNDRFFLINLEILKSYIKNRLRRGYRLGGSLLGSFVGSLGSSLRGRFGSSLGGRLGSRLRGRLGGRLGNGLGGRLGSRLGSRLGGSLVGSLGSRLVGRHITFFHIANH